MLMYTKPYSVCKYSIHKASYLFYRALAHLLFPKSKYPFEVGQHIEIMQYLIQIVPHLLKMTEQSLSSLLPRGTQTPQSVSNTLATTHDSPPDRTPSNSYNMPPVTIVDNTVEIEEQLHLNNSEYSNTSKTQSASQDISAQNKLQILRHLNRVISDHRKNIGVNPILEDVQPNEEKNSQHSDSPNTGGCEANT